MTSLLQPVVNVPNLFVDDRQRFHWFRFIDISIQRRPSIRPTKIASVYTLPSLFRTPRFRHDIRQTIKRSRGRQRKSPLQSSFNPYVIMARFHMHPPVHLLQQSFGIRDRHPFSNLLRHRESILFHRNVRIPTTLRHSNRIDSKTLQQHANRNAQTQQEPEEALPTPPKPPTPPDK